MVAFCPAIFSQERLFALKATASVLLACAQTAAMRCLINKLVYLVLIDYACAKFSDLFLWWPDPNPDEIWSFHSLVKIYLRTMKTGAAQLLFRD